MNVTTTIFVLILHYLLSSSVSSSLTAEYGSDCVRISLLPQLDIFSECLSIASVHSQKKKLSRKLWKDRTTTKCVGNIEESIDPTAISRQAMIALDTLRSCFDCKDDDLRVFDRIEDRIDDICVVQTTISDYF